MFITPIYIYKCTQIIFNQFILIYLLIYLFIHLFIYFCFLVSMSVSLIKCQTNNYNNKSNFLYRFVWRTFIMWAALREGIYLVLIVDVYWLLL